MPLLTLFSLFFLLSGYSIATEITGPTTVNGLERGSLTVLCAYGSQWEAYLKWWCRGAVWGSCEILVKTTGSEQEVKRGRLSIRDNQKNHTFTVTMKDLRRDDADIYWCGIEKIGTDPGVEVQVTIDPASTTAPTATPTTPTSTTFTALVTLEETSSSPTLSNHHSDDRHKLLKLSVLLPLIFSILLLLLVATSLLVWRMMKRQKKAGMSSEQVRESPGLDQRDQAASFPFLIFHLPEGPKYQISLVPNYPVLRAACRAWGLGAWKQPGGRGLRSTGAEEVAGGHRGNWERGTQGCGRDSCPTSEKEPVSTDDLVTPQPVFPVPGTAAPGERPLLCKPDPAADPRLPQKGHHKALLLCPG
ncbi:CMRF35-like molecule 1 isoform X2 [Saimiri boliviensis]|uniref:CMRF35-like molecule 1 isoform X2 n=1 Tax=Saimiri boliviensis TaxID=27679 RepID=UPI003D773AE0